MPSKKRYIKYSMRDILSCKLNSRNRIQPRCIEKSDIILFYRKIEYRLRFIEKSNTDLLNREIEYRPDL